MREMKDSGVAWIGKFPSNWEIIKIKYIADNNVENSFIDGDWIESGDISESGIRYYTTGNVGDGKFKEQGNGYITEETFKKLNCKFAYPDDLVISRLNEPYGRSCLLPNSEEKCVLAVDIVILRPNGNFEKRYLCYQTQCTNYQAAVGDKARGTAMKRISRNNLGNIQMIQPPLPEQHRIANFLDTACSKVDALIANQQAQIEKLKAYKQSLITEVVTHGLDPDAPMKDSGVEWIGMIPQGWTLTLVRYIGSLQNGISKSGEAFGSGYPFVSYGDIYKNYELPTMVAGLVETSEKEREQYSVEYGDIFFTRTSETIEEVGFSCVCRQTIPDATFAGFAIRMRPYKADEKILTNFAKYYFRGSQIRAYLVKEMNLVTRASLGQTLLKGMSVTIPPKKEQQQIADYLDEKCTRLDALIAIKQQKIEKLEQYKKSLIYEYVTGKKEVI